MNSIHSKCFLVAHRITNYWRIYIFYQPYFTTIRNQKTVFENYCKDVKMKMCLHGVFRPVFVSKAMPFLKNTEKFKKLF